jgi:hypothetical protein
MYWKKSILVVALLGTTLLAAACGGAEETTPAPEQTSPAVEQPAPAPEAAMPAPPEGTMPAPPEGIAPGERPPAPVMDLAAAAEKLGVTEEQLNEALGDPQQGPPDGSHGGLARRHRGRTSRGAGDAGRRSARGRASPGRRGSPGPTWGRWFGRSYTVRSMLPS